MSDWTSGYVADIGYTFGYYGELNPLRIKLAFLNAGLALPQVGTACELGFGQGLSTGIHAAASTVSWSGTDFNPAQAAFAQELCSAAGVNAHLFDDAFADFCARPELPDFDYIALHGIWSWISDVNRAVIVDFVRRKLKVGGVLYISYNTLPGWSAAAPVRHLLTEHAGTMGAEGVGIVNRIEGALGFTEKLLATNPLYARANPQVAPRFEKLKEQNRHYLAHEYFNKDWHPMYFADMAKWLEPAKLSFACSAHYLDYLDAINLTAEQQTLLAEIADPDFRQSVRDFMVNQQFRKDYWIRGPRKLSALEQAEGLMAQKVMLVSYRPDIQLKVTGILGESTMSEAIYGPILDLLADYKPRTIGDLEQTLRAKNINRAQLLQAVIVLVGMGHLSAAQDDKVIAAAQKQTQALNRHLMIKARSHNDISYLASPVTGGGVTVGRIPQLFALAITQGQKQPADWVKFVWQILAAQGQSLLKEGKALATPDENLAELTEQAKTFAEKQLPLLKALGVI
jgi:SAM-dependent methyltransferase